MNKQQFLDLLRYYFMYAKEEDVEEIISDYEEHFMAGYEQGLDDSEIIKSLGDPKEIYEEYLSEGIVTERKGVIKGDIKEIMDRAHRSFKLNIQPQLPRLMEGTSKAVIVASTVVAYVFAVLFWFITPIVLYMLSIQWHPFANIDPLPMLSPITMVALGCTGFFAGLTSLFIGLECNTWRKDTFTKATNVAVSK